MRHWFVGVGALVTAMLIVSPFYTRDWGWEFFVAASVLALFDYGKRWFKW